MSYYGGHINNPANIIRLSPHMHRYFDNRWTAIVPKASRINDSDDSGSESPRPCQFVLHIMDNTAHELFPSFQNTLIQHLSNALRRHILARFAWTVLMAVKPFITVGPVRKVIRAHYDRESGKLEYKPETLWGAELQMLYGDSESGEETTVGEHVPEHVAVEIKERFLQGMHGMSTTPTTSEEEHSASSL